MAKVGRDSPGLDLELQVSTLELHRETEAANIEHPVHGRGVGLDDLYESLPTQTVL